MATLDDKGTAEQLKTFGLSNEHRKQFGQSFLGSWLGQTIYLVGMLVVYFVTLALLAKYGLGEIAALHERVGDLWFWALIAAPFVLILLFSVLPTLWRAMRERRLEATVIAGDPQFKLGYLRLQPYGESHRESFRRLDGAEATVLNWLEATDDTLLYLSGASGVGKSSLLAADVLPKLRKAGWSVVETRLFGDPVEQLRGALLEAEGLFLRKPPADFPLLDLLRRAAENRAKRSAHPLLIVVEQFEEFLILYKQEGGPP